MAGESFVDECAATSEARAKEGRGDGEGDETELTCIFSTTATPTYFTERSRTRVKRAKGRRRTPLGFLAS